MLGLWRLCVAALCSVKRDPTRMHWQTPFPKEGELNDLGAVPSMQLASVEALTYTMVLS